MIEKVATICIYLFFMGISDAYCKDPKYDSLKVEMQLLKEQIKKLEMVGGSQKQQLQGLEGQVKYQNDQINNQTGMLDTAFDGVSMQISSASLIFTIFSLLFSVIAIGVGIYVEGLKKQTESLKRDNEILLEESITIKREVVELNKNIISNTTGLYKIIRNEETNHIVERLMQVPENIINVSQILVSRDIDKSQFGRLKEAYVQLKTKSDSDVDDIIYDYMTIFFQHFPGSSIFDAKIKDQMISLLPHLISNQFKSDIINTAYDYFSTVSSNGVSNSKEEINIFASTLSKSRYSKTEEVYSAIYRAIPSREDKFLLYNAVKKDDDTITFRREFGKFLLDFKTEKPLSEELQIINEIEQLK